MPRTKRKMKLLRMMKKKVIYPSEGEEYASELGKFVWKDPHGIVYIRKVWSFENIPDKDPGLKNAVPGTIGFKWKIKFFCSLGPASLSRFIEEVQRPVKPPAVAVVCLSDVKNAVLFTAYCDLPKKFIVFFHSNAVDRFLRAMIIYIQYYLMVREAMLARQETMLTKLRHPMSDVKEAGWSDTLKTMRYVLSREYCYMMAGEGGTWSSHHMNNRMHKSCSSAELAQYELFHRITTRVVGIALKDHENPLIEAETNRLFRVEGFKQIGSDEELSALSKRVIESHFPGNQGDSRVPIIREFKRPNREDQVRFLGFEQLNKPVSERLALLEAAYMCPEEMLEECNIKVGILGDPRDNYPPFLIPIKAIGIRNPFLNKANDMLEELKELAETPDDELDGTKGKPEVVELMKRLKCPVPKIDPRQTYGKLPDEYPPPSSYKPSAVWLRLRRMNSRFKSWGQTRAKKRTSPTSRPKGSKRKSRRSRRLSLALSLDSEDRSFIEKPMDEDQKKVFSEEINRYAKMYGPRRKKPPKEKWESSSSTTNESFETMELFEPEMFPQRKKQPSDTQTEQVSDEQEEVFNSEGTPQFVIEGEEMEEIE